MSKPVLKGWHVLAVLLASFAAIIGVNATFVVLALGTFPGEDEPKSYAQGLKYNATLREREAQAELGWRAEIALRPDASGAALVELTIHAQNAAPIEGLTVAGSLRRPTDAALDRALVFAPQGAGRYVARVEAPAHGLWEVTARAARADETFDVRRRVLWQPTARS